MDRSAFLRAFIRPDARGLEIGPSYSPTFTKASGANIEVVDYLDADGLRAKYAGSPNVDISKIEEVDYVVDNGDIAAAIDKRDYYDFVMASHVIEHMPDVIGFLAACETVLKPSGLLILAVPDKRSCFDLFQPLASTGAILQAHLDGRTQPSIGAVFDDLAYNVVRDGAISWALETRGGTLQFFRDFRHVKHDYKTLQDSPRRHDVHIWRFVPSSFRLIMNDLYEAGLTLLREHSFHETVWNEFFAVLSREGWGCGVDRMELAKRIHYEQLQISIEERAALS